MMAGEQDKEAQVLLKGETSGEATPLHNVEKGKGVEGVPNNIEKSVPNVEKPKETFVHVLPPGGGKKFFWRHSQARALLFVSLLLRLTALVLFVVSFSVIVTASEGSFATFNFSSASWDMSSSFVSLVIAAAICAGYLLLHCIFGSVSLILGRNILARLRCIAWIVFLLDQLLTYLLLATASASVETVYIARNGSSSAMWFPFCFNFNGFCDQIAAAIISALVGSFVLAICALISAYYLFGYRSGPYIPR